ncbi:MAG: mechanosensitive ion channel family protein [Candidatus Zixiibacteriota bacterium]|jgi:small-conductance mechanosensitive channel/CRP-like cAMP-binding protein
MWLENAKDFFGATLWSVFLAVGAAALVFVGGRVIYASIRRLLKIKGLRVSVNIFLLLLAAAAFERIFLYGLTDTARHFLDALIFVFGVYLLYVLIEQLLLSRVARERRPLELPRIVRDVIRLAVIVLATLFALKAFMGLEPTALIATSTVLSAVIGLAMQDTLANIFAGIALQIGKPFRVGDWVTAYNQTGTVVSTSWRSTRIKTRDNHLIEIPNANIAKTEIFNYSVPTPLQRRQIEVGVVYAEPPNKVKGVLREAALAAKGVLPQPPPDVLLTNYGDFAITYRLRYWLNDFADVPRTEDRIMTNIWYHFKRDGITIPFPIRNVTLRQVDDKAEARAEQTRLERIRTYLDGVELLADLSKAEKAGLATAVIEARYAAGEKVVRQGDPAGYEFFILVSGDVDVTVKQPDGTIFDVGIFGPGYYFGEMSLLTGEPRRATITARTDADLLVINKDEFKEIIAAHPKVAEKLSRAVAKRHAEIEKEFAEAGDAEAAAAVEKEYSRENVLKRIKDFFDLK